MKNKIELKKTILISLFVIIGACIIYIITNLYQYKIYTQNFNLKIEEIISKVIEKYPNISETEIAEIINSGETIDNNFFKTYGIDMEKEPIILANQTKFEQFILLNTVYLIAFGIMILVIFLCYNHKKDKKLKEITKYIEEINRRNYKLDIEDNTEDELSILKNEIYKTTITLKEQAENSLKDKISLKNSLSDISHQLKTPLTSINIMIDNILENPNMDEQTRNEFVSDIKRETTNINFLVQSLLTLSKFDANTINFVNEKIKIKEILEGAIKNVSMLADLKNIEVCTKGEANSMLVCDRKWQIEAITNILKNAIEHSKNNSKINIYYEQNKVYSKITIQDYGTGIKQEDLLHIFERFYKTQNDSKDSVGIGLSLAKTIIEKNNGYIKVESKLNKGTVFEIVYM